DSLQQATGRFEPFHVGDGYEFFGTETPRSRLQDLFTDSGTTPVDRPTTVLQSLALMNGDLIAEETHATNSRLLASVIDFPGFDTADRVETIFLAALTRRPTDEERETFIAYVESGGPHEDSQRALSDIFWVLLNSSEFLYNH